MDVVYTSGSERLEVETNVVGNNKFGVAGKHQSMKPLRTHKSCLNRCLDPSF